MGKLQRSTEKKKRYLAHKKKTGTKFAMTYGEWSKKGEKTAYYGKVARPTWEATKREEKLGGPYRRSLKRKKR